MKPLILKEFRELSRDRRTLAMLIVMPLLLLLIFGYAANFTVTHLTTTVVGPYASQIVHEVDAHRQLSDHLTIDHTDSTDNRAAAVDLLRNGTYDVAIVTSHSSEAPNRPSVEVLINGANLFAAQSANLLFSRVAQQLQPQLHLTTTILFNPDLKTSWVMIPAIVGLILTFIGTVITSIGLVRERESGTFEQLAVMPLKPAAIVMGKITPYFLLAAVDLVLITVLGCLVFHVPFRGNVGIFALGAALFLFVVLGIGVLISSVSQTSGQAVQLAIMTLLPQILLSGMIFPLSAMALGVRWIGYILPLTWFTKISQGVMLRDANFAALSLPLAILALEAVVVFGMAVLRLRRSLAPARPRHVKPSKLETSA